MKKIWREVYQESLRMIKVCLKYYIVLFLIYCIVNTMAEIKLMTVKEFLISFMVVLLVLILIEIIGNVPVRMATEKKKHSKEDLDPELRELSLEQYKETLMRREKNEIIKMYCDLYERDRRSFDINMKTVYGSLVVALLPVGVTLLLENLQNIEFSDALDMLIAAVMTIPLFLDGILTVLYIIEQDKIQRIPSVEKDTQDRIVRELASEYLGVKVKSNE